MKLNKYWESFFCFVLVISITQKKVFSRCNFSDNYVQVLSLLHSNVQLLYLLLFFAVVVVVAVLVALGLYCYGATGTFSLAVGDILLSDFHVLHFFIP